MKIDPQKKFSAARPGIRGHGAGAPTRARRARSARSALYIFIPSL